MKFKHAKHGDTIPWKRKFALLPKTVWSSIDERTYTVWFDYYFEKKTYRVRNRPTKFGYSIECGDWDTFRKMEMVE